MPDILFDVTRTGDLSRQSTVNWALEGDLRPADLLPTEAILGTLTWAANETAAKTITITTVGNTTDSPDRTCRIRLSTPVNASIGTDNAATIVVDDEASVTPAGFPYPKSAKWGQLTFPNPITRYLIGADQHPTSPLADGGMASIACDGTSTSSFQIMRSSGVFPAGLTFEPRATYPRTVPNNLKAHAILSLPNKRLLVFFYFNESFPQNQYSHAMVSTDDGVSFPALPAHNVHAFDVQIVGDQFQPRGMVNLGPGYGALGSPPVGAPQYMDRDYFYVVGNNQRQDSVANNRDKLGGDIWLARYKWNVTNGLSTANLNTRSRYSFFKGKDALGVPQWTADGGHKTLGIPFFANTVAGVKEGVSYFFQIHWIDELQEFFAVYSPKADGIAIAHAPTLWDPKAWRMLCYGEHPTNMSTEEIGFYMGGSSPQLWASASKLGMVISTYVERPPGQTGGPPGDNFIATNSSALIAL